jgi:hypothetical protein
MRDKNAESLRESVHKFRSILHLLSLSTLQDLLEQSRQVLQLNAISNEEIMLLIRQTEEECTWVKSELGQYRTAYDCEFTS